MIDILLVSNHISDTGSTAKLLKKKRVIEVRRGLWRPSDPTSCPKQDQTKS